MAGMKTIYHPVQGPVAMYAVDADSAVARHGDEWRTTPWTPDEIAAYRRDNDLPELELSEAQRAELSEDDQRRADALKLVQDYDEKKRQADEYEAKVAAARSFLKTPRPQMTEPGDTPRRVPMVPPDKIDIPENWQQAWNGPKKRVIAQQLGAPATVKVDEAEVVIKAEVDRRAALQQAEADERARKAEADRLDAEKKAKADPAKQ